jgi:membrane-associated phospholipid phosphatase
MLNYMNETKPTGELILFSFPKQRAIKYFLAGLFFWISALIIYFIPDLDHQILLLFNDARTNDLFASFWSFYTDYMLYILGGFMLALYFASFMIAKLKPFRMALFSAVLLFVIGSSLVYLLKELIHRPRPFVTYPDINYLDQVSSLSFPSRHAFTAFAETLSLSTALITKDACFKPTLLRYIAASLLITFAVSMSLSRIFVGVHYLTDILFAVGLAIILEVAIILLLQKAMEKKWLTVKNEKIIALVFVIFIVIVTITL